MNDPTRIYGALAIGFGAAVAVFVVLVAVFRLVQPGSLLVRKQRLPSWWLRLTAWARSRTLRLWCPDPRTAAAVAAHLRTPRGRRLSRLGVSIAPGPWAADVIVADAVHRDELDRWRAETAVPVASVVLDDVSDTGAFADALVDLAAALRWPDPHDASDLLRSGDRRDAR